MTGVLLYALIPLALLVTLGFLFAGIYSLAKGGDFAAKNSNKLMRARVTAQAIAVALLMLLVYLLTRGN
ncbi:twin transmembrane helix small protein [Parvularcula maris]|uniref:Twin transmembrane helix small protein n=1 Tax=Parvularcula maris TaxID=2965077 RepID=A0A9X2L8N3_9PROT|nr:twin transmembrane helix small protein [Parvularcula maris]MCQ8185006.1 twin transmembrane helix small protein [Parvularcula maris]